MDEDGLQTIGQFQQTVTVFCHKGEAREYVTPVVATGNDSETQAVTGNDSDTSSDW